MFIYIPNNNYNDISHLFTEEYVGKYITNPYMLEDLLEYAPIEVSRYYRALIKRANKICKKVKEY